MNEKSAQVDIASLRDGPAPSSHPARVFAGRQAQEAGKVPAGWESLHFSDETHQGSSRDDPDTWDRLEVLDYRKLSGEDPELFLAGEDPCLEIANLKARLRQSEPK